MKKVCIKMISSFVLVSSLLGLLGCADSVKNLLPSTANKKSPIATDKFSNITDIALGVYSACVIIDGKFQCWGHEYGGEFNIPKDLGTPQKILGGWESFCAITTEGLRCWGKTCNAMSSDCQGEHDVPNLINVRDLISLSLDFCAFDDTGVVCWHYNQGVVNVFRPDFKEAKQVVLVSSPTDGPRTEVCGIEENSLQCWELQRFGGINTSPLKTIPVNKPKEIAVQSVQSYFSGEKPACIIDADGVRCWDMRSGQVSPLTPKDLKNPRNLVIARFGACALTDEGLRCWPSVSMDPKFGSPELFRDLSKFKNPRKLVSNTNAICALTDDGVVCLGPKGDPSEVETRLPDNLYRHLPPAQKQ